MTYENIEVKVTKHFFGFVDTFSDVFFKKILTNDSLVSEVFSMRDTMSFWLDSIIRLVAKAVIPL